jgi:hypothetical protein
MQEKSEPILFKRHLESYSKKQPYFDLPHKTIYSPKMEMKPNDHRAFLKRLDSASSLKSLQKCVSEKNTFKLSTFRDETEEKIFRNSKLKSKRYRTFNDFKKRSIPKLELNLKGKISIPGKSNSQGKVLKIGNQTFSSPWKTKTNMKYRTLKKSKTSRKFLTQRKFFQGKNSSRMSTNRGDNTSERKRRRFGYSYKHQTEMIRNKHFHEKLLGIGKTGKEKKFTFEDEKDENYLNKIRQPAVVFPCKQAEIGQTLFPGIHFSEKLFSNRKVSLIFP